jgi:hypothetical protein
MLRWLTIAVTVLALAQAAHAEDTSEPPIGMITPGGPHYECGRSWATPITFRDLMANIDKWIGRCVRVRGLTRGYFFYGDLPDYYAAMSESDEARKRRGPNMGLYAKDDVMRDRLFRYRQEVEVVAMAYTCAHLKAWHEKEHEREDRDYARRNPSPSVPEADKVEKVRIWYLTGYCHYTKDPAMFVSSVRVIDEGPVRLEGAKAAADHGNLDELVESDPDYSETRARLTHWFDALRRRDGDALLKLSAGSEPNDLKRKDGWLYRLLNDRESGARFLFGRKTLPALRLYRAREADVPLTIGCLCKSSSCDDRWPIHSVDASLSHRWPYACMWVRKEGGKYLVAD